MKTTSVLHARRMIFQILLGALLLGVFVVVSVFFTHKASAVAGINQQMNFQARLLNAQGAVVPDGSYNIQFKIYQDGAGTAAGNPGGTLKWTESRLNQTSTGVTVINGYMSVQLGSVNPFASQVDWNQDTLWLSINIGNTNASCTPFTSCGGDGEMVPMKRLSATPYALNAGQLGGLTAAGFLQNGTTPQTADYNITGTGTANLLQAATYDTASALALNIGTTNATQINLNQNVVVANDKGVTIGYGSTGNANALLVQGSGASNVLRVDNTTAGNYVVVGSGDCTAGIGGGRLCVNQTVTGSGTGAVVNNKSTLNVTKTGAGGAIYGNYVNLIDTSSSVANTLQGTFVDASATTNTSASVISYGAKVASSQPGKFLQFQNGGVDTFTVANQGAVALNVKTASNSDFSVKSQGGAYIYNFDTLNGYSVDNGTTSPDNLIENPGFESDASFGFSGWSNLTTQANIGATNPRTGTKALSIAATGAIAGSTTIKLYTAEPGDEFYAEAWSRTGAGTNGNGAIVFTYYDATKTFLSFSSVNVTASTTYAKYSGSAVAPAGTAYVAMNVRSAATSTTGTWYYDDLYFGKVSRKQSLKLQDASGVTQVSLDNSTGAIQGGSLDRVSAGTLTIGGSNATNITLGNTAGTASISLSSSNISLGIATSATTLQATAQTTLNAQGSAMTIQGATGNGSGAGGTVTLQGGNGGATNANGGNLVLSGGTAGGTGAIGIVSLNPTAFSSSSSQSIGVDTTLAVGLINSNSTVPVNATAASLKVTVPVPTTTTTGRIIYITAANTSNDFSLLLANTSGVSASYTIIGMRQNNTATLVWNGYAWTAAGASSSTDLQSAYNNTLQNAGGAELIVSKTGATNGLTIRDSLTNSVDGTLLSVQTKSASGLFQVNSNVTEYASNSGAETAGGTPTTFPASTWSAVTGSTVTRYITAGNFIATGQGSVSISTPATTDSGVKNQLSTSLSANTTYNVSFTTRLTSGTFTNMSVYYSVDGTAASVACTTGQSALTSIWQKINCTFTTPASGITSGNALLIRQATGVSRVFYIDNLSVTIAADYNFATDGSVIDAGNFATNWTSAGVGTVSVTRNASDGFDASDSANANITTGAANAGLRNRLSSNPLPNTLYRITAYVKSSNAFTDFKVRYSPNNGTNFVDCVDYNTQTISTSSWTKVTCYITTPATALTTPYIYFAETASAVRSFGVDAFNMSISTVTTPNVQIGGGVNGGPTTLFTLDKGASAPIASDNDALLGSMYYDTSLGKLQCYEADGWGACGSSPDNIVTISPEYTNAVLHGTGIGTMTSDFCSDALNINDPTNGPAICGTNETYNFYKWTSPQASAQTYSIYVTYQLPSTFKSFASGQTSIMGRTDSANSTINYQVYRNTSSGLTTCGAAVPISTGVVSSWQTGLASGASDPSTCSFAPSDSIVFKISVTASQNANAYLGNLNFTYSNR